MSNDSLDESGLGLSNALNKLEEALAQPLANPLAVDGTTQRFEFAFELCWKWMKKILLEKEGIEAVSPKQVLQKAFLLKWIENEKLWLAMLNDRNLTSHTYKEEAAKEIYESIQLYYPELRRLFEALKKLYSYK
jgi:nucleotidyltransferase substrate binding protein (TIGR01987 family)